MRSASLLRRSALHAAALRAACLLLLAARASCDLDLNCQIFDETMVCDNEKARLRWASATILTICPSNVSLPTRSA